MAGVWFSRLLCQWTLRRFQSSRHRLRAEPRVQRLRKDSRSAPRGNNDVIGCHQCRPVDGAKVGANIHQDDRCFHVCGSLLHQAMESGLHPERSTQARGTLFLGPLFREGVFKTGQCQITRNQKQVGCNPFWNWWPQFQGIHQRPDALEHGSAGIGGWSVRVPQFLQGCLVQERGCQIGLWIQVAGQDPVSDARQHPSQVINQ